MKNLLFRVGVILLAVAGLVYTGDYFVFRYRVLRNLSPYDSITVNAFYAVPQKTGKMEYDFQSSQQVTCANSIFPHMGYTPCWYSRTHTDKQIQL
jgi:hypothetical protein